jgi:ribosomal protein L11 methylase PrmA
VKGALGSYRDPENAAVVVDGRWYRVASPSSATALMRLRDSGLYRSLVEEGAIVRFEPTPADEAPLVMSAFREATGRDVAPESQVFEVETVDVITYPWEWPNHMLQAGALLTLDIREQLMAIGLDLKDASALNVQFRGLRPVLIDIGSIEVWRPNPTWNAARQFVEHFINPLAVGSSDHVTSAAAWDLSHRRGLRSEVARSVMPRRLRWRPSLWVLQTSTRPMADHAPVETKYAERAQQNPELALRATRSLTKRLRKQTMRLGRNRHKTTWQRYGDREHYGSDELRNKLELTRNFAVEGSRGQRILDVGGNDGMVAVDLVEHGADIIMVMDADAGALDVLSQRVGGTSTLQSHVMPLYADLVNMTPDSGLLDSEYLSLASRINASAVLCQAVLHHIVISQGVPMKLAVKALAGFGAPLLVEFATEDDPKVQVLRSQIPNWSGVYSTEAFLDALGQVFLDVSVEGHTSPNRIVVTTGQPKS